MSYQRRRDISRFLVIGLLVFIGCEGSDEAVLPAIHGSSDTAIPLEQPDVSTIYELANRCVSVVATQPEGPTSWLRVSGNETAYVFDADGRENAARFFFKASDLGSYLLYDYGGGYLFASEGPMERRFELDSDVYLLEEHYVSGAEWEVELSDAVANSYRLRNRRTGRLLGGRGLVDDARQAVSISFEAAEECREHPEMSLDATGTVQARAYEDGALFGIVDTHSHILSNFGFGGGGIMHGAAFHRLGVAHALGDCELFHGVDGRADLLGSGSDGLAEEALIELLLTGRLPEPSHATDGWPTFTSWPSRASETHQTQYYRWIERAWMGGLRLVVQHAVSNEAFCDLMADTGFQPVRWECEDMANIDRELVEIRRMERYIDAQWGGPGRGFFRIVETPEQARQVIGEGKLAVVLGIEVSNLFDCYLTPRPGSPVCDPEYIEAQLDHYHDLGVRVLFPNHKFDNAFTPGDGHKGIVELGNFMTTSHWSNFVEDCPDIGSVFDRGPVQYGGFNAPRDAYYEDPPNPRIQLSEEPLRDLLPYVGKMREPSLEGDWCQKHGLTDAGATLIEGIMKRGMIPEIDHLPRRSYLDVFAMLEAADYPAAGTHGRSHDGRIYGLGGISNSGFARCADPETPGSMAQRFRDRRDEMLAAGSFVAEGFGFDLNGLAGVPRPRFGPLAGCAQEQQDPVEYPFDSYAGDVTFTRPAMGERIVDFNTEGMIHLGLLPELVEDARRTGVSDEDLDILFRSAEGYVRMWEKAEARARQLGGE